MILRKRPFTWILVPAVLLGLLSLALGSTALAASDMVRGEKITLSGNVEVPADEVVNGDVVTISGNTLINGVVNGDVFAVSGNVTINGRVNGDVAVITGNVTLGPTAVVRGDVNVPVGTWSKAPGAQVGGSMVQSPNVNVGDPTRLLGSLGAVIANPFTRPAFALFRWLTNLALVLLVVVLFPAALKGVGAAAERELGKSLLVGFLTALAAIPVGLMLLITLIGPIFWGLFLFVAGFMGYAALSLVIGRRVREAVRPPEEGAMGSMAWDAVIGTAVLALVGLVPLLGGLFKLLVSLAGLGAVLFSKFGINQPWFRKAA